MLGRIYVAKWAIEIEKKWVKIYIVKNNINFFNMLDTSSLQYKYNLMKYFSEYKLLIFGLGLFAIWID